MDADVTVRALVEDVIEAIADGDLSGYRACEAVGISYATFMKNVFRDEDLLAAYQEAQRVDAARTFDTMSELADRAVDKIEGLDPDDKRAGAVASVHRLRLDTLKWVLARKDRARYGDAQQIDGNLNVTTFKDLVDRATEDAEPG